LTSKERDNADAVLGDFGIARYNEAGAQTMWGTPFYMAPEIVESHFLKHNYDEKVDIWSLGVLGYQMALEEDMESVSH
jgi:serine/threonine protein kinase